MRGSAESLPDLGLGIIVANCQSSGNLPVVQIVAMQNRWNNRISDGCVYAQV